MDLFGQKEIRALSWKQPFAELMLHGKIETRTWDTKYRGLVLICASKTPYNENQVMDIAGVDQACRIFNFLNDKAIKERHGVAIAVGKLVHSRPMTPEDEEKCFVSYHKPWFTEDEKATRAMSLWCHVYEEVRAIVPFDWKGSQGWRKLDEETIKKIQYLDGN